MSTFVPRYSAKAFPPAARGNVQASVLAANPMQRFGFSLLLVFLFVAFGRVAEIVGVGYIALLSALLALVATVLTGGIPVVLRSRTGILLAALTIWMCVSLPFSVWRGGSFGLLKEVWSRSFMAFLIIGGCMHGLNQSRKAMNTMALATIFIVIATRFRGTMETGRLAMTIGTLGNPNDLAAYLLLGMPFCLYTLITKSEWIGLRVVCGLSIPALAILILRTGSRAGLLTFVVLLALLFVKVSTRGKIIMLIPAALLFVALPFVVSDSVLQRFATLVDDTGTVQSHETTDAGRQGEYAATSIDSRSNLLRKSLKLTIQNPIFGVGPGMFSVAVSDYAKALGERAPWQQTHNTYTQVSSELGIPALLLYLALLAHCIRSLARIQKATKNRTQFEQIRNIAFCLQLAWASYCINALFGSFAYLIHVPILAGMTEAFQRAAMVQLEGAQTNLKTPVSAPPWGRATIPAFRVDRNA